MTSPPLPLPAPFNALDLALTRPTPLAHEVGHHWSEAERNAVVQAWASARPLLIRGEAGCGKSQLAAALAEELGVPLYTEIIHPRYEATDLVYKEDPVKRLAEAQIFGAMTAQAPQSDDTKKALLAQLDTEHFIEKGKLHLAFEEIPNTDNYRAHPKWPSAVVLIDEIDKADADLPNTLLGILANRSFSTPKEPGKPITCHGEHYPLILITTNEDREMPAAFLRRCAVLNLRPPKEKDEFCAWLIDHAKAHQALSAVTSAFAPVAEMVWADRQALMRQNEATVGLAEALDLLYALAALVQGSKAQGQKTFDLNAALVELGRYALIKTREADQQAPRTLPPSPT